MPVVILMMCCLLLAGNNEGTHTTVTHPCGKHYPLRIIKLRNLSNWSLITQTNRLSIWNAWSLYKPDDDASKQIWTFKHYVAYTTIYQISLVTSRSRFFEILTSQLNYSWALLDYFRIDIHVVDGSDLRGDDVREKRLEKEILWIKSLRSCEG